MGWSRPDRLTGAAKAYPEAFGSYRKELSLHNGRAWYRGTANTKRVIYLASNGNWHIAPEESMRQGWSKIYQSGDSECPGNHESWRYIMRNGTRIADSDVKIKYLSKPGEFLRPHL